MLPPALQWLYSVQQFGIKPGLDNTRRLLKELQLPSPRQRIVHVAGTNGKGSVCAFMESILRAAEGRTGLFTSPHLISFCERIQVNGQQIPMERVCDSIFALKSLVEKWEPHPTFFELTLMLALDWFDRSGVENIVLETGMGGRWDATNAITPVVSVITPIGMDHEQYLGNTLTKIAREKAGIIKQGIPVVSAPQESAVAAVLSSAASAADANLTVVSQPWLGQLPLAGVHQQWNAALAVAALQAAGVALAPEAIEMGLNRTVWPARFQRLDEDTLIIDGGHNPHGVATLVDTWRAIFGEQKATIIFGAVAAKDFRTSLELLRSIAARFLCVTLHSPRAVPAEELAEVVSGKSISSLASALEYAKKFQERRLVCGSLYLCGEVLASRGTGAVFESSSQ